MASVVAEAVVVRDIQDVVFPASTVSPTDHCDAALKHLHCEVQIAMPDSEGHGSVW
jgi:hypothetical protein